MECCFWPGQTKVKRIKAFLVFPCSHQWAPKLWKKHPLALPLHFLNPTSSSPVATRAYLLTWDSERESFPGTVYRCLLTFGFPSLAGRVEGLVVAVAAAGRLGGAAGTEPEARLMGFLFNPPVVVGVGCLGRGVGCVLAFDVEVLAGWVVAKGFRLMVV